MGVKSIGQMTTELQRRLTQLSPADAEAAINRAIEWLWKQGSYTFQLTGSASITPSVINIGQGDSLGQGTSPVDCDLGKAMFLANAPQGTPIEKRGIQEFSLAFGLNIPANKGFSVYTISGRNFLLRPSQTAQDVGVRYHKVFAPYGAGAIPPTPEDCDDQIITLAEALERRIYDIGDSWVQTEKDAKAEILKTLNAYRSVSQEPMSAEDASVAIEERTKLGHA